MIPYTVLDAHGTPVRWGECPLHLAPGQADPGETVLYEHPPTPDSLFVDNEWVSRPPKPARCIGWDSAARQWIVPVVPMEELRARKREQIDRWREEANESFVHENKEFHADPLSWKDIMGTHGWIVATGQLPPGWPGGWKAKDKSMLPIQGIQEWMQFYGAAVAAGSLNFVRSQNLKNYLESPERTAEEIETLTWDSVLP